MKAIPPEDAAVVVDAAVGHGDGICFDNFGEALALAYPNVGDLDLFLAVCVRELVTCDEEFIS